MPAVFRRRGMWPGWSPENRRSCRPPGGGNVLRSRHAAGGCAGMRGSRYERRRSPVTLCSYYLFGTSVEGAGGNERGRESCICAGDR